MNVSKGASPKGAKVAPKKRAKVFGVVPPIPSTSTRLAAKNTDSQPVKSKPVEDSKVRKEEVDAQVPQKANKKKRIAPGTGATGWKRVKLAEDMQFQEAGFFMLEELTFDPSDPTSVYDDLIKRIPSNQVTPLEEEPIIDTNDSDLDELDEEAGTKKGKKSKKQPTDIVEVPVLSKKEKKAEQSQNASSAPEAAPADKKASKPAVEKSQKKKEPVVPVEVVEEDEEEVAQVESMDVDEEAAVSGSEVDADEEDAEVEDDGDDVEDDEEEEVEQKSKGGAKWRAFIPQALMEEEISLPEWTTTYNLHKCLLLALRDLEFSRPTDIQRAVIPIALGKRLDVIGASQTGSGKTLAFGLPIIQQILELDEKCHRMAEVKGSASADEPVERDTTIKALIMSPTRELGLQIVTHLEKLVSHAPHIRVASLIGGLSQTKQLRILNRRPDILVCTPGRLWEIISSGKFEACGQSLADLRWLVFDEADKMVEFGKFAELQNILRTVYDSRKRKQQFIASGAASKSPIYSSDSTVFNEAQAKSSEAAKKGGKKGNPKITDDALKPLQTFVFSATISIGDDARKNLKKVQSAASKLKKKLDDEKRRAKARKSGSKGGDDPEARDEKMMEKLMQQIDFQREVELLDLTNRMHTVAGLEEAKMYCLHDEKDFYLYYFIMKYGGKSIVFVNAISNIKRLLPLMVLLRVPAFGMHANMEQHHRMKNLEKFIASTNGVLITTDVMARGVDIPQVDHVIHYSIPTSAEIFVHRSGRTARAFATGLSIHVVDPEDRRHYTSIMHTLGRSEDDVPDFPVEMQLYAACKRRVKLATELDKLSHDEQKKQADAQWLKARATDLDADIPEDLLSDDERDEAKFKQKAVDNQRKKVKYAQLKDQLRDLLTQPLGVHEKNLELARKVKKHGEELALALTSSAKALPIGQSAVTSYITKNIGAKQIFATKSTSFQSPPTADAANAEETKQEVETQMEVDPEAPADALAKNAIKRPSAAFEDVQKTKGTKDALFSRQIMDKVKNQRKTRMQAMGRQGTPGTVSGPLKNKR